MLSTIIRDIRSSARGTGAVRALKALYLSPGLSAVLLFRLQDSFFKLKLLLPAYLIHRLNMNLFGIDILPGAKIGGGLRIDHPVGIVIGAGARIGTDCILLQNVTVGTRFIDSEKYDNQYPVVGNKVIIGAGAVILGDVNLGDECTIGANSVILADVLDGTTVSGLHVK
jgi:serine O-acetyltransferase